MTSKRSHQETEQQQELKQQEQEFAAAIASEDDSDSVGSNRPSYKKQATDSSSVVAEVSAQTQAVAAHAALLASNSHIYTQQPIGPQPPAFASGPQAPTYSQIQQQSQIYNQVQQGGSTLTQLPTGDPQRMASIRLLVTTREAGVVIGKGGTNIAQIREEAGVRVVITGQVPGADDRVCTLEGQMESLGRAMHIIGQKFEAYHENSVRMRGGTSKTDKISMRLLVPQSTVGILIGRKGSRLKEIQTLSGVYMQTQGNMLPNSTERVVILQGTPDACSIASHHITHIVEQHMRNTPETVILYVPLPPGQQPASLPYGAGMGMGGMGMMPSSGIPGGSSLPPNFDFGSMYGTMMQQMQQMYQNPAMYAHYQQAMAGGAATAGSALAETPSSAVNYYLPSGIQTQESSPAAHAFPRRDSATGTTTAASSSAPAAALPSHHTSGAAPSAYTYYAGPTPGGVVAAMPQMYGQPAGPQTTKVIDVPNDSVGTIIGKGGYKINEIRSQFGIQMDVGETSDAPMRSVTLTGTHDACENAAKYILNFVEVGRQRRAAAIANGKISL